MPSVEVTVQTPRTTEVVVKRPQVSAGGVTSAVTSVAGKIGAVLLEVEDVEGLEDAIENASDKNYTHNQILAGAIWNVAHGLNKYPSVSIIDSAGSLVLGDVLYIDLNNLTISFSAAFSGKAYLN